MHEFALAQYLVASIIPQVPADRKVTRVNLRIGVLAGVAVPSLEFGFEAASQDTPVEGAELSITHVGLQCRCRNCQTIYEGSPNQLGCPHCDSGLGEIVTGREMQIDSIEVE